MALTKNDTIKGRVETALREYEVQSSKYRANCSRFRDVSLEGLDNPITTLSDAEEYLEDQAIGDIPHVRTNVQTKVDSIALSDPDWYINSVDESLIELQRQIIKSAWDKLNMTWLGKKALLNRFVGGMGIVTYLHDDERGPIFEHVRRRDFAPDPHVSDWKRLRFGVRKIRMPREDAQEKYRAYADLFFPSRKGTQEGGADTLRVNAVELRVYHDHTTEAVLYNDTVIYKGQNLYGKPPYCFLRGDLSPDREDDTGDFDNCLGTQMQLTAVLDAMNNFALHGGPINLYNRALFVGQSAKGLEMGRQQGWLDVQGGKFEQAIKRLPAEEPSPMLGETYQILKQAMDEEQAVTPSQRGAPSDARFATDVMVTANLSGARGNQERIKYELFLNEMVEALLLLLTEFSQPTDMVEAQLLQALSAIQTIRVVESSTVYKDPAQRRQDAVLLFNLGLQAMEAGLPVNMPLLWEDVMRAFDKRDVQKYLQMQQAPQGPLQPGAAPGSPPAVGSAQPAPPPPAMGGGGSGASQAGTSG